MTGMQPPPKTPAQPKRVFPSSIPSVRRASTSAVPATPPPPAPKAPPNTSTPTGIPAFRSLRSLLPFGPSKHATPVSSAAPSNTPKSPFSHFGSVRRSTNNKERKASLEVELPVISIDRITKDVLEESAVRRSVSCSGLEPMGGVRETLDPFGGDDDTVVFPIHEVPILRTPSPGPPISADLSTILEADTSGLSKHIPSEDDSQRTSPDILNYMTSPHPERSLGADTDTSALDFSTINVENQVLNAMRLKGSNSPHEWTAADTAVIIEGEDADASFNFSSLDPDLAALLSPHRQTSQGTSPNAKKPITISMPIPSDQPDTDYSRLSFDIPQFALAPSPNIVDDRSPLLNPLQSRLPRQQSSLPRLRPSLTPSHHPTSTVTSRLDKSAREDKTIRAAPPSPLSPPINSAYCTSSAPSSPATAVYPSKSIPSTSTPYLPRNPSTARAQTSVTSFASSSTLSRLRAPFTPTLRTGLYSTSLASGADHSDFSPAYSPSSSTTQLALRPSLDSTSRDSGSFDCPRPPLSPGPPEYLTEHTLTARPSLQGLREPAMPNSNNGRLGSAALDRVRKRSMSVQERWAGRLGAPAMRREASEGREETASETGDARSASSLSGRMGPRWGPRTRTESAETRTAPMTDWLGPRTLKAFKAAGLLDPEREQQDHLERPGLGNASGLGAGPTHGRYPSMRSTSEYNPRAASRLAFSEAGGSSISRRGSGSGTVGSFGLESPTMSSGSRDTARSPSTAPTSVSGSVFAFQGRERDWDEMREMKDKHLNETEALLGALSDSQRTTRLLREENGGLRERLEQTEAENDALRRVVAELTKEAGDLRVQVQMLKSSTGATRLGSSTRNAPVKRSGLSRPLYIEEDQDIEWSSQASGTEYNHSETTVDSLQPLRRSKIVPDGGHHNFELSQAGSVGFSSTPATSKHKRRFSTTSSIFPVPPANMTMLLHDEQEFNGSLDQSQFSPTISAPIPLHADSIVHNASAGSISPTDFSMNTGSPGSLFLRPEHELHLGDMDSLDFGIRPNADIAVGDEWSD